MSWSDDARCLYCGSKLALHRKVRSEQFCSDTHERSFRLEQDQLALHRLEETHQQLHFHPIEFDDVTEPQPTGPAGLSALAKQHIQPDPPIHDTRLAHQFPVNDPPQSSVHAEADQPWGQYAANQESASRSRVAYDTASRSFGVASGTTTAVMDVTDAPAVRFSAVPVHDVPGNDLPGNDLPDFGPDDFGPYLVEFPEPAAFAFQLNAIGLAGEPDFAVRMRLGIASAIPQPLEYSGYELAVPETLALLSVASEMAHAEIAGASADLLNTNAALGISTLASYIEEPLAANDTHALLLSDLEPEFPDWSIVLPISVLPISVLPVSASGTGALPLAPLQRYRLQAGQRNQAAPPAIAPPPVLLLIGLAQSIALPCLDTNLEQTERLAGLFPLRVRLAVANWRPALRPAQPDFTAVGPGIPDSHLKTQWATNDQSRLKQAFTLWSGGSVLNKGQSQDIRDGSRNAWAVATDFWRNAPREFKMLAVAIPVLLALVFHPRLPKISVGTHTPTVAERLAETEAARNTVQASADSGSNATSLPTARFVAAKATTSQPLPFAGVAKNPKQSSTQPVTQPLTEPAPEGFSANLHSRMEIFKQTLAERAGVELNDDFRGGLDDWQSRGDLAAGWSFDSNGFVRPQTMALYRPSLVLRDYDLQFLGLIDKKAMSWMVRAQDFDNYYAIKLVVLKTTPLPVLGLRRYAVINGKAEKPVEIQLPYPTRAETMYRIGMSVHDDTFLLTLQGNIVDTWSEPRLRRGGIGFFASSGEESRLRWVQVSHQYDMLGRLCAYLAPYKTQP